MATIDVMTFNLRMPVSNCEPGDPDHWLTRIPAGIERLRSRRPAVVGTQEGCDPQWDRLLPELPHYQRLGTGRERGHKGEYSAILVDTEVLEVASWTQFTLSETPDVLGSRSWGSSCTRIAVVADLWRAGRRDEAGAAVPLDLGRRTNLLGTEDEIAARIDLHRAAGITTLLAKLSGGPDEMLVTLERLVGLAA